MMVVLALHVMDVLHNVRWRWVSRMGIVERMVLKWMDHVHRMYVRMSVWVIRIPIEMSINRMCYEEIVLVNVLLF